VLRIRDVLSRIPDPDPNVFSSWIPDPDPNIFSSRILHETWNANLLFLAFYSFRSKVLVFVIVKKIRYPGSETRDPEKIHPGSGSEIRKNSSRIRIPDPESKGEKAPDPGSGSATLLGR
jgi:hypothetical protein